MTKSSKMMLMEFEVSECTAYSKDHTSVRMLAHPGLKPPNFNFTLTLPRMSGERSQARETRGTGETK